MQPKHMFSFLSYWDVWYSWSCEVDVNFTQNPRFIAQLDGPHTWTFLFISLLSHNTNHVNLFNWGKIDIGCLWHEIKIYPWKKRGNTFGCVVSLIVRPHVCRRIHLGKISAHNQFKKANDWLKLQYTCWREALPIKQIKLFNF